MNFYAENQTDVTFPFDIEETASKVILKVLETEEFNPDVQVSLLITDGDEVRALNNEYRGIDNATDVLSFPNLTFTTPGGECDVEMMETDPDTGALILGDIVICAEKVLTQAEEYGHSVLREFAFLVAHSALHLLGYDHETSEDRSIMESKQEWVLNILGITRDELITSEDSKITRDR